MSLGGRYSDYDKFAWVYNKHWGDKFVQTALTVLRELVQQHLPPNAGILDLCCGTGQLAQALTEHGYQVTGLDRSEEMLRIARKNVPNVKFILDDARTFILPATYHLVVSVFDSLNHILTLEELAAVFRNVYAALRKGGLFLFDLNVEEGYKANWQGSFGIVEEDHVCVIKNSYSPEERIARFDATIFRLDNNWHRSDVTLLQKCYSEGEVRSALEVTRFADINTYTYDKQTGFGNPTKASKRVFFLCHKS